MKQSTIILVYPSIELKDEYIDRYKKRGNNKLFITLIQDNWDEWIKELKDSKVERKIELKTGQYLTDYVSNLC